MLNNVPAPYFTPLFARVGRESDWDLLVCYSANWNAAVGWEAGAVQTDAAHRTIVLDERWPRVRARVGSFAAAALALLVVLLRERPDYLICYGYTLPPQTVLLLWALLTRTPFAISGDANYYDEQANAGSGVKRTLKGVWLRWLARHAAALITVGTANELFWQSYGAGREKLFRAGFAVENDLYERAGVERRSESEQLRARHGLEGKVVFLFVGRLVKRKHVDLIIAALRQLAGNRLALVIAGAGAERAALEAQAEGDSRVIFLGKVAPSELPVVYATADVLVLPAEQEPWGLVVNEAMASGLAVIASPNCGAAVDLVDAENGCRLAELSLANLTEAMRALATDTPRLRQMQARSRQRIAAWSMANAARGIIHAVDSSSAQRVRRSVIWKGKQAER